MQITNVTGGGPSSNTVKTMFISNTNAVRGGVSTNPTNQNLNTMVTTMNPRIAARIRGASSIRVQSATVGGGTLTTTTGAPVVTTGGDVACADDTSFLDIDWSRATTSCGTSGAGSLAVSTRLNELYDVELVGAIGGSFLVYNSASDYWTYTNEISGGTF